MTYTVQDYMDMRQHEKDVANGMDVLDAQEKLVKRMLARAEARAAKEAAVESIKDLVLGRHNEAWSRAETELASAVLDLHAPQFLSDGSAYCGGCDFSGYEAEETEFPCRTWLLVAGEEE